MNGAYIRRPEPARGSQDCLQLNWAFGLHKDFKSVIHNVSSSRTTGGADPRSTTLLSNTHTTETRKVFYPLAHVGVLYDAVNNTQQHLLGHAYTIIASCCSHNRRFIVTCDEGDRSLWWKRGATSSGKGKTGQDPQHGNGDDAHNNNGDNFNPGFIFSQEEDFLATAAQQEEVMARDPAEACSEEEDDGSLMIVWDVQTCLPVCRIPIGKYGGVVSCAMSLDGMYIATLNRRTPQELIIWGWTAIAEGEEETEDMDVLQRVVHPEYVRRIPAQDEQTFVRFSPDDPHLLCTNGLRRVLFWSWVAGSLSYYSPPILQSDWNVPIGSFTQSIFVPGTTMACSGTVDGDVVLWQLQPRDRVMKEQDKTLLKMVRTHTGGGVTALTTEGGYIVTGGMDGHVKFFDSKLRLVAWFEDLNGGPIISISFDRPVLTVDEAVAASAMESQKHLFAESTVAAAEFVSPDFMVSTANAMIIDIPAKSFHTGDPNLLRGKLLVQGQDQSVQTIAAHPTLSRLAIGGYSGNLHMWDYQQRRVVLLSLFRSLLIQRLAFDPTGTYLVVGFTNGHIKILDAETLESRQTFKPKKPDPASRIVFSADGRMMAVGTVGGSVGLYELQLPRNNRHATEMVWEFIGNHKTHKAPICGLQFQSNTYGEAIRLLSVGGDKRLIEYNLVESDVEAGLLLRTAHKITQGPLPTGFVWAKDAGILSRMSRPREAFPTDGVIFDADTASNGKSAKKDNDNDNNSSSGKRRSSSNNSQKSGSVGAAAGGGGGGGDETDGNTNTDAVSETVVEDVVEDRPPADEDYLLIATNEYKISMYLSDWSRQCVKTVLAPTFGGPVSEMLVVGAGQRPSDGGSGDEDAAQRSHPCIAYATKEKVVGLIGLPLNGDPCASMGLVAHPGAITAVALSHDGRFLFTAGGDDQAVMQWRVDGSKIMSGEPFSVATMGGMTGVGKCMEEETPEGEVPLAHLTAAVEGGADGTLMKEVIDYFFYAQIRAQGEETTAKRELLGAVHFSQLPNLLRALGYYPTELDIGHLTFEVANAYGPRDVPLAEVDVDSILLSFAQFMRLYVNYRPIFGITRQAIEHAFAVIGADPSTGQINRDVFFQMLSTKGEPLHSAEIAAALTSLLGDGVRVDMLEDRISARDFAENLLGFEDYDGVGGKGAGGDGRDHHGSDDDDDDGSTLDGDGEENRW